MTLSERFGRNLFRERRRLGVSQEALGDMAGIHRSEVQKLEAGKRDLRLSTVVRLAYGLGIDPGELVKGLRP